MAFWIGFISSIFAYLVFFYLLTRDFQQTRFEKIFLIVLCWLLAGGFFYFVANVVYEESWRGMLKFAVNNIEDTLTYLTLGAMFIAPLCFSFAFDDALNQHGEALEKDAKDRKSARLEEKMAEFYGKLAKLNDIKLEIERKEKDLEQRERSIKDQRKELELKYRQSTCSASQDEVDSLKRALVSSRNKSRSLEQHRIYSEGFSRYCEVTLGMDSEEVVALKHKFKEEYRLKQSGNEDTESL